jgi:hypothetical protein
VSHRHRKRRNGRWEAVSLKWRPTIGTSRGERPLPELVCVAPRENPDPGVRAEVAEESEAGFALLFPMDEHVNLPRETPETLAID